MCWLLMAVVPARRSVLSDLRGSSRWSLGLLAGPSLHSVILLCSSVSWLVVQLLRIVVMLAVVSEPAMILIVMLCLIRFMSFVLFCPLGMKHGDMMCMCLAVLRKRWDSFVSIGALVLWLVCLTPLGVLVSILMLLA